MEDMPTVENTNKEVTLQKVLELQLSARLCCGRLWGDSRSQPTLKGSQSGGRELTPVEQKGTSLCGDQEGHLKGGAFVLSLKEEALDKREGGHSDSGNGVSKGRGGWGCTQSSGELCTLPGQRPQGRNQWPRTRRRLGRTQGVLTKASEVF